MKSLLTDSNNFFALFEQPVQFDINESALDKRLRELQKQYHPDNINTDKQTVDDKQHSDSTSALINHAYQTLKSPDSRASYLLQMADQDADVNHSIADLDFLDDAMDLRIEIDETEQTNELQNLHQEVDKRLQTQASRFTQAYDQRDWKTAIDATQKLKFLVKLNKDIAIKVDEISQQDDDTDDLYL